MAVLSELTTTIDVQLLESAEELVGLEREWADLWNRCPSATPFQSPDWLIPFWTHMGEGSLWVFTLRTQGRLVGLAPFFLYTQPATGERHLFLLGTGVTDYLDVLFEPQFAPESFSALLASLERRRSEWDCCDLQQLRSGSALLAEESSPGWTSQISVQEVCPVLTLPEVIHELPRVVPTRMLEKLRYYRRRLSKLGPAEVELARMDSFEEFFHRFLELHRARWAVRGQTGVLDSRQLHEFHRESAQRMLLSGTLRLYGLRIGNSIAATLYAFAHRQHTYFYLSGFDPAYASYSPGTLLIGHAIDEAIREGSREFDFLRGREAYKYLWGSRGRLNYRRILWPPSRPVAQEVDGMQIGRLD